MFYNCAIYIFFEHIIMAVIFRFISFFILSQNEHIIKLYEKWCELEKLKYKTYTLKPQTFPALTENKEFRPIRNMIIKTVLKLHESIIDNFDPVPPEPKEHFKLSDLVNNKHGLYKYGKALLLGDDVAPSSELGEDLLMKAVAEGNINAERYLAREYISGEHLEQDIDKGIEMLTKLADDGDALSAYQLGKIYMRDIYLHSYDDNRKEAVALINL